MEVLKTSKFSSLLNELEELHNKKSKDYGSEEDPFLNLKSSINYGVEPWRGTLVKCGDKMARLSTYAQTGKLANESVRDSLLDLASYAIVTLILLEEEQSKETTDDKNHLQQFYRWPLDPGVLINSESTGDYWEGGKIVRRFERCPGCPRLEGREDLCCTF